MPEPAAALEVAAAVKRFGPLTALDGVSLRLQPGEWLGLVGPNGAGKTTLMRAIAGLTDLDRGRILLGGEEHRPGRSAARCRLGLVPQEVALYPALTARENLAVFGRLYGVRGRDLDQRIAWALSWAGLEARANGPVSRYSGGMKRRLNIACGVLHRPAVVLLDEPTVGVDPQGRGRIWAMLEELRGEGAALLQSTHHLDEVQMLCDRLLILDHGRVIVDGTFRELAATTRIARRALRLEFDRVPSGFELGPGFRLEGATLHGYLEDVPAELGALLERAREAGLGIADIHVQTPSLEEIFTQLTGTELRE